MQTLDVVLFAPWIGPLLTAREGTSAGGAETQILMLARGLSNHGRRVGLVAFERNGIGLPDVVEGITIITIPDSAGGPAALRRLLRVLYVCRVVWKLPARVLVQRIAGPETGLLAVICKLRRRRFVYSSANVVDFDYAKLRPGRLKVWFFRLGIRLAHAVVVQTAEQVDLCRQRFGRTPTLIRSIAEPAARRSNRPEAFLWVGRTDWYKHPEAYVELARALPEARFWMIPMPMDEAGQRRVEELERGTTNLPNLDLLRPRPREELVRLIPRAVAMVNTSDYEGMPNVFLEGWARGVPALALSHDPDGVIERERLGAFAHGSHDRLAELARQFWVGREDQAELAERCRAYVAREHSLDSVVDRWIEVVESP